MLNKNIDNEGKALKAGEAGKKEYPWNTRLQPWLDYYSSKICRDLGLGKSELVRTLLEKEALRLYAGERKTNVLRSSLNVIQGILSKTLKLVIKK
jgi:hypothetical protein